jgi:hypothetical protein
VQTIATAGGFCNREGPCDKDSSDGLTGVVVELSRRRRRTGILLAHELGHYLGLPGGSAGSNLMGMKQPGDLPDDLTDGSTEILPDQASAMREHCFVRPACEATIPQPGPVLCLDGPIRRARRSNCRLAPARSTRRRRIAIARRGLRTPPGKRARPDLRRASVLVAACAECPENF